MYKFILLVGPFLILVSGCGGSTLPSQPSPSPSPQVITSPDTLGTNPPPNEQSVPIPKDVTYTIINKSIIPRTKRSLDIRLNKKISEDVLKSIALELKNSDSNNYERTFIVYYLPDMQVGAGGWATTHFDPHLKVRILGLTIDQENALNHQPNDPTREIIGSWIDDRPLVGNKITIFRKEGKLFLENKYKDGSSGTQELVEKNSPVGRRFDKIVVSRAGDHWILDSKGDLELRDNEGLISKAKKIP